MDSLLPEIASALSEVQIGTFFRFAEMAPAAAAALVIAVLAAVVRPGSLRCGRSRTADTFTGASGAERKQLQLFLQVLDDPHLRARRDVGRR